MHIVLIKFQSSNPWKIDEHNFFKSVGQYGKKIENVWGMACTLLDT